MKTLILPRATHNLNKPPLFTRAAPSTEIFHVDGEAISFLGHLSPLGHDRQGTPFKTSRTTTSKSST